MPEMKTRGNMHATAIFTVTYTLAFQQFNKHATDTFILQSHTFALSVISSVVLVSKSKLKK